ncbi:MAG TPA: hypothetical protein DCP92_22500 [Nitrospiraceae bacterium]|jgi:V8-like Glu-specific endopeptidase|nr:hypothetical protein [Nitrospiraceae bacterium]
MRKTSIRELPSLAGIVLVICLFLPLDSFATWDCYKNIHKEAVGDAIKIAPTELRDILRQHHDSVTTEINHVQGEPPSDRKGYTSYYKDIVEIAKEKDAKRYEFMARQLAGITIYMFSKYNPLIASRCDEDMLFKQALVSYGGYKNDPDYSTVNQYYFNEKYKYDVTSEDKKILAFYNILVNEIVNLWTAIWKDAGRDTSGLAEKNTIVRGIEEKRTANTKIANSNALPVDEPAFITVERLFSMPQEYINQDLTFTRVSLSGAVQSCHDGLFCLTVKGNSGTMSGFFVMLPDFAKTYMTYVNEDRKYKVDIKVKVHQWKDILVARIKDVQFVGFSELNGRIFYDGDRVREVGLSGKVAEKEAEAKKRQEAMVRESEAQVEVQQLLAESMAQKEKERRSAEEQRNTIKAVINEAKQNIDTSQQTVSANLDGGDIPKMLQKAKAAVVTVISGKAQGSGFIVSSDGLVITNAHVMAQNSARVKFINGLDVLARVIRIDERKDIALLKIEEGKTYPFLIMGDSEKCQEGEAVLALGTPFGLENTVTRGIVSAKRFLPNLNITYIQTDAAINHGNSGGPLINVLGEVIGINTFKITKDVAEGLNFAISINDIKNFIDYN